jgi:hypothetical protein
VSQPGLSDSWLDVEGGVDEQVEAGGEDEWGGQEDLVPTSDRILQQERQRGLHLKVSAVSELISKKQMNMFPA